MGRNNAHPSLYTGTIAASGTLILDLDLSSIGSGADHEFVKFWISTTYAATASSTGLSGIITDSAGKVDPAATAGPIPTVPGGTTVNLSTGPAFGFDSTGTAITFSNPDVSSGSPQTKQTKAIVDLTQIGRWLRFSLINLDTTNSCTVRFIADL